MADEANSEGASSRAAKMRENVQIVTFNDWEGEFIQQILCANKIPGALASGFHGIARRYRTSVDCLKFVYRGKVIPFKDACVKTTGQLDMDTGWAAEISVRVADGAEIPPDDPISISFAYGQEIITTAIKPSWGMGRVCQLYCKLSDCSLNTLGFLYNGNVLPTELKADPTNPSGWNIQYVRNMGMRAGDVIVVGDKKIVDMVEESDPLDFVIQRQRIAKFDGVGPATRFGNVLDHYTHDRTWLVGFDKSSELYSKASLIKGLQHYQNNKESDDLPRVVDFHIYDDDDDLCRIISELDSFLLNNGGDLSLDSLAAFWSKQVKKFPKLKSAVEALVMSHSMQTSRYYLEIEGQPLDKLFTEVVRAYMCTSLIIMHSGFIEAYAKEGLEGALELFPGLRETHELLSTNEGMVQEIAGLNQYVSGACERSPVISQPMPEKISLGFEDTKGQSRTRVEKAAYHGPLHDVFALYAKHLHLPIEKLQFMNDDGIFLDAHKTPASYGMKNDDDIFVFRKYATVFANAYAMKFHHAPENATLVVADGEKRVIRLIDTITYKTVIVKVGENTLLNEIARAYAEHIGISVRDLSFAHYAGRVLFLSSAGKKNLWQLGLGYMDAIIVSLKFDLTPGIQREPKASEGKKKTKKKRPGAKSNRKKKTQHIVVVDDEEEKRRHGHSEMMSRVFEEADSAFRDIRQRLAAMNLERTLPKEKKKKQQTPAVVVEPRSSPLTDGLGGKAGKTHFYVQVGEVSNLYKSSKPSTAQLSSQTSGILIDLHGLTKDEALEKLEESLPRWVDTALKGSYPWVIPVKIVVGGGNQILADLVEKWIKAKDSVSNAPKNLYE